MHRCISPPHNHRTAFELCARYRAATVEDTITPKVSTDAGQVRLRNQLEALLEKRFESNLHPFRREKEFSSLLIW